MRRQRRPADIAHVLSAPAAALATQRDSRAFAAAPVAGDAVRAPHFVEARLTLEATVRLEGDAELLPRLDALLRMSGSDEKRRRKRRQPLGMASDEK